MAIITETWFKSTPQLERFLNDAEQVTGFGFVRKDRSETDSQASRGGGVAIVYKKSEFAITKLGIPGNFEIVAMLARRTGQRRKIIVIGAYINPAANADTSRAFLETVSYAVRTFKAKYVAPYFVIAGDFNMRKIGAELREFGDIKLVKTPPTRGKRTLDLVFTNFPQMIKTAGTLPALFSHQGTQSDHIAVQVSSRLPRVEPYTIQKYSYLKQTAEGDQKFGDYIKAADFSTILELGDPSEMTARLHDIFKKGLEQCYETKTTTRKSNQPQWVNQYVLKLIAWRRAVFRREGRSDEWKRLKKKTRSVIKHRKAKYNEQKRSKMLAGDSKSFHKSVKAIISNEKQKSWSPKDLSLIHI